MAQFVKRIRTDLNKTLETYNIGTMVTDDENSRKIYVDLYNHGSEVAASGTVTGIAKLHNGTKYAFSGAIESGKTYIIVPKAACTVPGPVTILIRLTEGDTKTTIGICKGFAIDASDPEAITEGETTVTVEDLIENLDELLAAIDEAGAVLNIINCVAVVESTSIASTAYQQGEYFISDHILYTVTDPIAEGGGLIFTGSGKNCEPTTISSELYNLKSILHSLRNQFITENGNGLTITLL